MNEYFVAMYGNEDTIEHHGILGQKWGVRRYQNEDGSLTDAGRKKYSREGAAGVSLKKKSHKELKQYAEERIKTYDGDALQAIHDEEDKMMKRSIAMGAQFIGSSVAGMALIAAGAATLNPALTTAGGALVMSNYLTLPANAVANGLASRNSQRNIEEIKRQGGIADIAVTNRNSK